MKRSIKYSLAKINSIKFRNSAPHGDLFDRLKPYEKELFLVLLTVFASFFIYGAVSIIIIDGKRNPVVVEYGTKEGTLKAMGQSGLLVGSKNGTKYHYPWCVGAQRMKEENRIWFSNKEEAEVAGYTPAGNCSGL